MSREDKSGLTKRAAGGGYAPRFLGIFWLEAFPFRGRVHAPTHRS
jgi:hypothetical protein